MWFRIQVGGNKKKVTIQVACQHGHHVQVNKKTNVKKKEKAKADHVLHHNVAEEIETRCY